MEATSGEFFTDFGEAFQYSNQPVATGGYPAAAAAGAEFGSLHQGYVDAMHERVFGPIGMAWAWSTFSFDEAEARRWLAIEVQIGTPPAGEGL